MTYRSRVTWFCLFFLMQACGESAATDDPSDATGVGGSEPALGGSDPGGAGGAPTGGSGLGTGGDISEPDGSGGIAAIVPRTCDVVPAGVIEVCAGSEPIALAADVPSSLSATAAVIEVGNGSPPPICVDANGLAADEGVDWVRLQLDNGDFWVVGLTIGDQSALPIVIGETLALRVERGIVFDYLAPQLFVGLERDGQLVVFGAVGSSVNVLSPLTALGYGFDAGSEECESVPDDGTCGVRYRNLLVAFDGSETELGRGAVVAVGGVTIVHGDLRQLVDYGGCDGFDFFRAGGVRGAP